jgi:hypothetical protein
VAQLNQGRVSDPAQAALSGSQNEAPGSAGGNLTLGNRLVLRVDGEGTSEIALGEKGAERLLGKGHLAAKLEGAPEIVYGQVPFVSNEFLAQTVAILAT